MRTNKLAGLEFLKWLAAADSITIKVIRLTISFLIAIAASTAMASDDDNNEKLFARTLKASSCEQTPNNGRICSYKFGKDLNINIKDAGGADTVIAFNHSDVDKELYAVMYFGCIAVVPGNAHPRNYNSDYAVFISPKSGLIYRTVAECKKSL